MTHEERVAYYRCNVLPHNADRAQAVLSGNPEVIAAFDQAVELGPVTSDSALAHELQRANLDWWREFVPCGKRMTLADPPEPAPDAP